jgi:dihydroorotate dehydrogenase electron transfer subunit
MSTINKAATQVDATIISNKRVGAYHQIILSVGEAVRHCTPGNFIAIQVG